MLVRDGEQTTQPLCILPVRDFGIEQFENVSLTWLQVELKAVSQRIY